MNFTDTCKKRTRTALHMHALKFEDILQSYITTTPKTVKCEGKGF